MGVIDRGVLLLPCFFTLPRPFAILLSDFRRSLEKLSSSAQAGAVVQVWIVQRTVERLLILSPPPQKALLPNQKRSQYSFKEL